MAGGIHLLLHALVPLVVALLGWREQWLRAWLIFVATMVVDVDHLVAVPIYDSSRCSIGFHPLHSGFALVAWPLLAAWRPTRLVGIGLVIHMLLDALDCVGVP
jgi:hypothetical protein